jgi:outer membrane protein assembly factor BamB
MRSNNIIVAISLLATFLISPISKGQDWPSLRGADGLGSANPSSNLAAGGEIKLETRWKKKIGSGYSSVVISNGRVVTMYTDGTNDLLASLSASTGETIWTLPVGPKFKGENGSFDGPLSTPAIMDGKIYAISATGKILCVDAESGNEVWTKELVDDFGATQPLYGFVTSPVLVEDTLVIQTGIKDKSLMGLDPATGEPRWAVSSDRISSQTPFATTFKGKQIVLACGGVNLTGVNPFNFPRTKMAGSPAPKNGKPTRSKTLTTFRH